MIRFTIVLLILLAGCEHKASRTEIQLRKDREADLAAMAHSYELQSKHAEKWIKLDELERQGETKVPAGFK